MPDALDVFPPSREPVYVVATDSAVPGLTAAELSDLTATRPSGVTETQQQFKDDHDINVIVKRFGLTGELPYAQRAAFYGDFSGVVDYDSAVALVDSARKRFEKLPPEIRIDRFHNNPGELISAVAGMSEEDFKKSFLEGPAPAPVVPAPVAPAPVVPSP